MICRQLISTPSVNEWPPVQRIFARSVFWASPQLELILRSSGLQPNNILYNA